ncbi:Na+/H+ antiporter NhaC family protein [Anaerosphaera multitolerans]|uniref:Na+/H+ antiporter NhaC family protein n=1 Tax=Anaerosphaera multitolerans TaxID=2487351 RepID=A0A437S5Y3_9FIRM|nr:Na+/H+ antiporter NhaC family protein [Anaerosphaera multitolerans]RVU54388.1 Na+/H+ antiporter NhaC family protein [Anaerosphaera multitolerans]
MKEREIRPRGVALLPFLVFIVIYLGSGIYLQTKGVEMAFYQFPAPTACLIGVAVAFIMFKGTMAEKFTTFAKGVGNEDIIIMCMIYLMSGAFSEVSKLMGGVDSVVNLGLSVIPPHFATAGIFIIACFMALATGTSMGTLAAIAPIAIGIVEKTGLNYPLMMAAAIGGSMFGDNLSVISDTTIAATRTQGCGMRDKFKCNIVIALPAAIITFILLLIFGRPDVAVGIETGSYSFIKVLPYLFVLIFALGGMDVFAVLGIGIVLSGVIGVFAAGISFLDLGKSIYDGMMGMMEVFLTSIFIAGMAEMVSKEGGLLWLIEKVQKIIKGPKSAEVGIAAMVSVTDVAIANNTVSIIVSGPIARGLCEHYKVDPRRSASLLDIFACVMQGAIPYGAQILMIGSLTGGAVSAFEVIPLLWYQWLLAILAIISIFIPFADGVIKKDPWNFEHWVPESELRKKQDTYELKEEQ